jgi:hypothetical protein
MATVRWNILQDLDAVLKTLDVLREVHYGRIEHSNVNKPAATVIPMDEPPELNPPGVDVRTLQVAVRIVVDEQCDPAGQVLDEVMQECEAAVMADVRRGGYAQDTRSIGSHWLYIDAHLPEAGCDLLFAIDYRRATSDPSEQI